MNFFCLGREILSKGYENDEMKERNFILKYSCHTTARRNIVRSQSELLYNSLLRKILKNYKTIFLTVKKDLDNNLSYNVHFQLFQEHFYFIYFSQ